MFFDDVTTPKKDSNQRQYFAVTCTSDVTFSTIHLAWVHQCNMNLQRTHEDDIWLNKTIPAFWFIIGNTSIFTFAGHEKILRKLRPLLVRDQRIGVCHLKLFVLASLCRYTQTHAERRACSDTKRLLWAVSPLFIKPDSFICSPTSTKKQTRLPFSFFCEWKPNNTTWMRQDAIARSPLIQACVLAVFGSCLCLVLLRTFSLLELIYV